jgi:hypothetical protein
MARVQPFGAETFSDLEEFSVGASQNARLDMNPISVSDVFLTVTIMSTAFLIEIGFFVLIGMF